MITVNFSSDEMTKRFILGLFNKSVREDGIIVENTTKSPVLSVGDGQEISIDDFGAIKKGSEIFVRNDIVSLVNFYRRDLKSSNA